jgi:hypothetical protein
MARRKAPRRKRGKSTLIDKSIGEIRDALEALRHTLDSYLPTARGKARTGRKTARRGPRMAKTARWRMAAMRPKARRRPAKR